MDIVLSFGIKFSYFIDTTDTRNSEIHVYEYCYASLYQCKIYKNNESLYGIDVKHIS